MDLFKHTLFINLKHRTDRLEHVLNEFKKMGIETAERFEAIKTITGNVGCSLSHIRCIEIAKERDYPHVFICEDDITFTNPQLLLENMQKFNAIQTNWDMLVIGGNTGPPFQKIEDFYIRVFNVQTTTGYIIQKHYYDTLLNNFKFGMNKLIREPENKKQYAIDMYWKHLQQRDQWYMIIPLTVVQYYDYSDIEQAVVSYEGLMLDLEKKELIEMMRRKQEEEYQKQQFFSMFPKK